MNFNIASGKQSCQICTQQESVRACYIDVVFSLRVQAIALLMRIKEVYGSVEEVEVIRRASK